jgi:sulfite reductase alpha subunit-like flavoprotein
MICGSQRAAHDIRAALSDVIAGSGTTLEDLKSQKRHLEDVY